MNSFFDHMALYEHLATISVEFTIFNSKKNLPIYSYIQYFKGSTGSSYGINNGSRRFGKRLLYSSGTVSEGYS